MAITPPVVKAEKREEFGKGSARRLRRDGKIPGVLYEAGIDNVHFACLLYTSPSPRDS